MAYNYTLLHKTCDECGIGFLGRKRNKYCSAECSGRVANRTAHAREKALPFIIQKESIGRHVVYTKYNNHCALCGIEAKGPTGTLTAPELDHIIPLSRGGNHTHSNIQLLCRACNQAKGSALPGDPIVIKPRRTRIRARKGEGKRKKVAYPPKTVVYTIEQLIQFNNQINKELYARGRGGSRL